MPFLLNIIPFSMFSPPFPPLPHFLLSLSLHTLLPVTSRPSSMAPPSGANHISQPFIHGDVSSSYAERKSHRFVKWLSRLFKRSGGHNGGWPGRFPQFLGDENTVWHTPNTSVDDRPKRTEKENEDLDHAIALSLSEDTKKPSRSAEDLRRQNDCRWRIEDNEDPAKGLQGDVNPPWYPPNKPPPQYYPSVDYKICGRCHRDIGYGNYLGCMGAFFHPECFCCRACGHPITEYEFSLSGMDPYHKSCFKEMTHPKCEVCHQFIPTNGSGLIEYRCHPFWSQKYCPSHEHDDTARCCSCERLESWNTTYISLGDGRSLCLECVEYAVMDTGDCQQLYYAIRDFYEGLYMKLDQQIPMLLVERQALNEAIVGEKAGHRHMPETRGLCLSEEQTVSSIAKRPKIGGHRVFGMKTQPQRLIRKCEVTAILVLYGLPRLLTGAILAHELMHGWLRLNGFRDLTPEVEEGICQVLSHLWLESEVIPGSNRCTRVTHMASSSSATSSKKGGKSDVEKKLGEFFMHQIANDASPTYGEGFRAANAAVNKYSLRCTLEHMRLTGNFPL